MITDWPTTTTQTGPSPVPSPIGRGVITELPLTSCCSLLTVLVVVVSHVVLHSLSPYFICLNISVQYVHSVYLCLSVILSINIKNTAQHVLSVILCLSVILSISINFPLSMYALFVSVICMKSGGCRLLWRRALSSIKKGVFLDVEGHVLEWRRACSWNEWGRGWGADGCWVMVVRCWWLALVGVGWWLLGVDD